MDYTTLTSWLSLVSTASQSWSNSGELVLMSLIRLNLPIGHSVMSILGYKSSVDHVEFGNRYLAYNRCSSSILPLPRRDRLWASVELSLGDSGADWHFSSFSFLVKSNLKYKIKFYNGCQRNLRELSAEWSNHDNQSDQL